MGKFILIAVISAVLLSGCDSKRDKQDQAQDSQAAPRSAGGPDSSHAPAAGAITVEAELEDIAGQFPANDIYNYAYVMKYKVLKVVHGEFSQPEILIAHYNPRFARNDIHDEQDSLVGGDVKSFQVGDKHSLVLEPLDKIWSGAVEDEYYKDTSPRFWAVRSDKL